MLISQYTPSCVICYVLHDLAAVMALGSNALSITSNYAQLYSKGDSYLIPLAGKADAWAKLGRLSEIFYTVADCCQKCYTIMSVFSTQSLT